MILQNQKTQARPTLEPDLHTTTASQTPEDHTVTHIEGDTGLRHHLSDEGRELLQLAALILASVGQPPGDFSNRCYDTRKKGTSNESGYLEHQCCSERSTAKRTPINPLKIRLVTCGWLIALSTQLL